MCSQAHTRAFARFLPHIARLALPVFPRRLVAPVYVAGATSRSVYLPLLSGATWTYFYNDSSVGSGGSRVTVLTPIDEFPLFYIKETPPPPPVELFNATSLFSALRNDTVLCLLSNCYDAVSKRPPA